MYIHYYIGVIASVGESRLFYIKNRITLDYYLRFSFLSVIIADSQHTKITLDYYYTISSFISS